MTHEKLEEAKRLYQTANQDQRYVLESLFPELRESEDERIRKFLIEDIKDTLSSEDFKHYNPEHTKKLEEALAWLEKQSEQKSQRMISAMAKEAMYDKPAWSEEDEKRLKSCLNIIQAKGMMGVTDTINTKWLKSLKERHTWKPSDEQMEAVRIAAEIGTANSSWAMGVLKSMYQDLKKLKR